MPPIKEAVLAPFFQDVDDYDCKLVELDRDVTCGDILEVVARELGVKRKGLALMGNRENGSVRLHGKEPPVAFMQVKGVQSLADLPSSLRVKAKKRSELSLEQALKIQDELLGAYSTEVFVLMMMEAKAKCKKLWKVRGSINTKDYSDQMKGPLEMAQEMVLPKWGYDATAQGMLQMQFHFSPWDPLPEIQKNIDTINRKIGFDYAWVGEDDLDDDERPRDRNFGIGGKLKMLFLYGGGCNTALAKMQCANIFKESPMYQKMEFAVLEGPHESHVSWHVNPIMQQMIRPFGETIYLYYERVPYANSQREDWPGIEDSLRALRDHLKKKGPYDGLVGFDMGAELLLQAARLQQEGDPGLKGMFRFMVLFTAQTARHLASCARPKAPLHIPCVHSWSTSDDAHAYTLFEESALFFPPEMREVITHNFGHMPPRWNRAAHSEALARLSRFLEAMYSGEPWAADLTHPENAWGRELQMPVERALPGPVPVGGPRRLLVVHDPLGAHEYETDVAQFQEALRSGLARPMENAILYARQGMLDVLGGLRARLAISTLTHEAFRAAAPEGLSVEAVEYTREPAAYDWHPRAEAVQGFMRKEDMILEDEHEATVSKMAQEMLEKARIAAGDCVGIVGLGTGGFVALALARAIVSQGQTPLVGLWLLEPPTRLPSATTFTPGYLGDCRVSTVVSSVSCVGAPWCYETATRGPFAHSTFESPQEAVGLVVDDFSSICASAEKEASKARAAAEAKERAKQEAEALLRDAEEKKAQREAEEKARREAEAQRKRDAEERRAKEAAEAAARREREAAEAEERRRRGAAKAEEARAAAGREAFQARCSAELAKGPQPWFPVSMEQLQANHLKKAPGMLYGLEFPWNGELLKEMGAAWLTEAFHAAGTLPRDNRVAKLKDVKEFVGGGACFKLIFEVEYEKKAPDLHTRLFAKIPFPLEGKTLSDRMSSSVNQQGMELTEINTYRLLESHFPFRIPKYYFGDISNETTNFILITERVPFGEKLGEITCDPAYDKFKDWELRGPVDEYYYLLVRMGAQVAGMYKAGSLAPLEELHRFYPTGLRERQEWGVRPESSGMPDQELRAKLKMGADFVETTAKVLFPPACTTKDFVATWKALLAKVNAYGAEIMWWVNRDEDYIAWSHANMNVDNVWFWRDEDYVLHAGVLDWGGAGCASVGMKMYWWLYCCEYEFLHQELDGLVKCFIEEYSGQGGPELDRKELAWQFMLCALNQGAALLGTVPQIYRMCPKKQWPTIKDRKDPRIAENVDGKNTLRIYVNLFVNLCQMIRDWDLVDRFDAWVGEVSEATQMPRKAVPDV